WGKLSPGRGWMVALTKTWAVGSARRGPLAGGASGERPEGWAAANAASRALPASATAAETDRNEHLRWGMAHSIREAAGFVARKVGTAGSGRRPPQRGPLGGWAGAAASGRGGATRRRRSVD